MLHYRITKQLHYFTRFYCDCICDVSNKLLLLVVNISRVIAMIFWPLLTQGLVKALKLRCDIAPYFRNKFAQSKYWFLALTQETFTAIVIYGTIHIKRHKHERKQLGSLLWMIGVNKHLFVWCITNMMIAGYLLSNYVVVSFYKIDYGFYGALFLISKCIFRKKFGTNISIIFNWC